MRDQCLCKNIQKVVSEFGVQITVSLWSNRHAAGWQIRRIILQRPPYGILSQAFVSAFSQ
jgi:prophage tail gpP-like protein